MKKRKIATGANPILRLQREVAHLSILGACGTLLPPPNGTAGGLRRERTKETKNRGFPHALRASPISFPPQEASKEGLSLSSSPSAHFCVSRCSKSRLKTQEARESKPTAGSVVLCDLVFPISLPVPIYFPFLKSWLHPSCPSFNAGPPAPESANPYLATAELLAAGLDVSGNCHCSL